MKISECTNAPTWLRNANVTDENVTVTDDRYVVWHGGVWRGAGAGGTGSGKAAG